LCLQSEAGAVNQNLDAPPLLHCEVDQALHVLRRLIRSGDANAAEFLGQRFALAG